MGWKGKEKYFLINIDNRSSAWCPLSDRKGDNIVALFAEQNFNTESFVSATKESISGHANSLIQLWTFRSNKAGIAIPVFALGIAVDFGRVRSLQWCPSGGPSEAGDYLPRLGLLAAGCEDGAVRIFPVPELEYVPGYDAGHPGQNIYKCDGAIVTLRRPDGGRDDDGHIYPCVKVAWFRGRRHRAVAASFADGNVALWDLETGSSLLRDEQTNSLYPYKFFRTHLRYNQTFLDLSTDSDADGFPVSLLTGSSDRMVFSWDLGSTDDVPVRELRRFCVTDVAWLNHYPGNASISHDDSFMLTNTRYQLVYFGKGIQTRVDRRNLSHLNQCPMLLNTLCP
jgi:WD40 repeat protein